MEETTSPAAPADEHAESVDAYLALKKDKRWHHDIKLIDGRYIEEVVLEFQRASDKGVKEALLAKIIQNYEIFKAGWSWGFSRYLDNSIEAGELMHDEIVWKSACKFDRTKVRKPDGKAFNAYLVSAQLNSLKNMRNTSRSHKNHPRVKCPVCGEEVFCIDEKHLSHIIDFDRYIKMFPKYTLVSHDGLIRCPFTGERIPELTEARINRFMGKYTVEDFKQEFHNLLPRLPVRCPMTNTDIPRIDASYPSTLLKGYSEDEFVNDFTNFPGVIVCPFTGKRKLEITQEHLDKVVKNHGRRVTLAEFEKDHPNFTFKAKKVPVVNPYTGQIVPEITLAMLAEAGTDAKTHFGKHATLVLGRRYDHLIRCPWTGRRMYSVTKEYLDKIGKSVYEFYRVTCRYPLQKWQVKCATDGSWVDSAWAHIEACPQRYAPKMTMQEFEAAFAGTRTKAFVSTNSFFYNDSGEQIHLIDLFGSTKKPEDLLELEDSLLHVAQDDLDRRIIASIRKTHTVDDLFYESAKKETVPLSKPFAPGRSKEVRSEIRSKRGVSDFDLLETPAAGATAVTILVPGRETVRKRLFRMISDSDIR